LEYELFYWRTSDGTEVDFVLYGPRGLLAFEIKRSNRYGRADLTGLRALKSDYPMAQCHLLYGGEHQREEAGIRILPLQQGFMQLAQILKESGGPESSRREAGLHPVT
jgi:predicted AAA+ superfamily ATPase